MERRWNNLNDWAAAQRIQSQQQSEGDVLPRHRQVKVHSSIDYGIVNENGVRYQRCGGGRRVIRKTGGGGN